MQKITRNKCLRFFVVCGGLVCLLLSWEGSLQAQTQESLLIGPGDVLHVQVLDTPDLEEHARVTDAGELNLILGGNVKVAALTAEQASHAIEQVLLDGHYLLQPRVLVTIEVFSTQRVSVLGEVKAPGAYSINTPLPVLQVLTLAGGLTDSADRKLLIERHGTDEKVPYFFSNQPGVAIDTSVRVNPGDTILVPKAGIVYALGDVARPGGYTMTNNEAAISLLELMARAGGTPPTAVPSHAKLIRKTDSGYVEMPVQLSAMQKGKRADMPLQAGDIVYVPFSYLRNFAMGASGLAAAAASAAVYRF
jgi:polysaccharide export outer membrane protein